MRDWEINGWQDFKWKIHNDYILPCTQISRAIGRKSSWLDGGETAAILFSML